ncbi:MAG TPA: hypothetical protein VFC02_11805 [Anaerolineales bacterium]|nr:hypothetical protein [Anaerolineales bacterium]
MRVFTAVFAIASGVIVLLGYFFPIAQLDQLRLQLIDWAIIIAGMAVLIGIYNLVAVQMEKIRARQKGSLYGALLILSLVVTFGLGLVLGPNDPLMRLAVDAVIVPVEASLMSILAVTLIYASIRLFRRRIDVTTVLFLLTAVLFLLAIMPTPFGPIPGDWIITQFGGMLSRGGSRGLLLGIALGTLLTGLRVLFGIDRPYGGN